MGTTGGSRDSRVYRFELSLEQRRMGNNDDWFREKPERQRLRAWVCLHAYVFLLSNGRQTSSLLAPELRLSLSRTLSHSLSLSLISEVWLVVGPSIYASSRVVSLSPSLSFSLPASLSLSLSLRPGHWPGSPSMPPRGSSLYPLSMESFSSFTVEAI
jgi:hypothetical protein